MLKRQEKEKKYTTPLVICPVCNTKNVGEAKVCSSCGYIFESKKFTKKKKDAKKEDELQKTNLKANQPHGLLKEDILSLPVNKIVCKRCFIEFDANLKRCPKCGFKK